jgi:hypothetical protein
MCCLRNEDLPQNGLHEEEMRDRLAALAAEASKVVDASTTKGDAVHSLTEGPFTTETRAGESLQWQFAVPVIEKL